MHRLGIGLVAIALFACGGEEGVEQAPLASWTAPAPQAVADPGDNTAPRIAEVRIEPAEPAPGDSVRAIVRAHDPEGQPIELGFVWSVEGRRMPEDGDALELAGVERGERVEVIVTPSDGLTQGEPAGAAVQVRNRRPVLTGIAMQPDRQVSRGEDVVALPQARDPDGDLLEFRYAWRVNGRPVEGEGNRLPTRNLRRGDEIEVRVVARDGSHESDALRSASVRVANGAPEILSSPEGVAADGRFRYQLEARDPDGDPSLRYDLKSGPDGMRVDAVLGEVTWKPEPRHVGTHTVEVAVEDSHGARTVQVFELTVKSTEADSAPASPAP